MNSIQQHLKKFYIDYVKSPNSWYFNSLIDMDRYLKTNDQSYLSYPFNSSYKLYYLPTSFTNYFLRIDQYETIYSEPKYIAGFDLMIEKEKNHSTINYYLLNDKMCVDNLTKIYGEPIDEETSTMVHEMLLNHCDQITKMNELSIIRCDVHDNLKKYNKYFKSYGYQLTDEKCTDNPFWLKTFKNLNDVL